jgi:hypothetical protein
MHFETGDDLLAAMRDAKTPLAGVMQLRLHGNRHGILEEDFYRPGSMEAWPMPSIRHFT